MLRAVRSACLAAFVLVATLSACAKARFDGGPGRTDPLVYDRAEVSRAQTLAIFVPGALASAHIFDPAQDWRRRGYALAWYRLPGMDGLPLDHALSIEGAAAHIATYALRHRGQRLRLVGYSTGGSVVIAAAARIARACPDCDLKVAAISPAVAYAGGIATLANGAFDMATAALRAPALTRGAIWGAYFRTLLFGRAGLSDPVLSARATAILSAMRRHIVIPDARLAAAHSADLRHWRPAAPVPDAARKVRFYVGLNDPVFATWQTLSLARATGGARVVGYRRQGHLLLLTEPRVFDDILRFFEEPASRPSSAAKPKPDPPCSCAFCPSC